MKGFVKSAILAGAAVALIGTPAPFDTLQAKTVDCSTDGSYQTSATETIPSETLILARGGSGGGGGGGGGGRCGGSGRSGSGSIGYGISSGSVQNRARWEKGNGPSGGSSLENRGSGSNRGYGPGDGTGNAGVGPKDGTGYGATEKK